MKAVRTWSGVLVLSMASLVAPATATTYLVEPDGNRDIDYLDKAITVRSQNGDPNVCIIDCEGTPDLQRLGFAFASKEGSASVLAGVTVRNCFDEPIEAKPYYGPVYCAGSSPTITDCIFSGNFPGMRCVDSSPILTNCSFVSNLTGAMYCSFSDNPGGSPEAHGSWLTGGLMCWNSSPTLTGCSFLGNSTGWHGLGGALSFAGNCSPMLTDCKFSGNTESAIVIQPHQDGSGTATLIDCAFSGNVSAWEGVVASLGGAMFLWNSATVTLTNCTLSENTAVPNLYSYGGAVAMGGFARVTLDALGERSVEENSIEWDGRDQSGRIAPGGIYLGQLVTPASRA